jgi:hypothetical protein
MIRFKVSYSKAIESIVWLANKQPGIDIYHIVKILFYADKEHLNKYGRPILGDVYIHADNGPMPSAVRDIVTKSDFLSPMHIKKVDDSLKIKGKYYNTRAKRKPDLDYFSKSDIECLENSFKDNAHLTFDELYRKSHQEKCYLQTGDRDNIDYALMIDEDNPHREELLEDLLEYSMHLQV